MEYSRRTFVTILAVVAAAAGLPSPKTLQTNFIINKSQDLLSAPWYNFYQLLRDAFVEVYKEPLTPGSAWDLYIQMFAKSLWDIQEVNKITLQLDSSEHIDTVGDMLSITRNPAESDYSYRNRLRRSVIG
jgi:hypothetical protein